MPATGGIGLNIQSPILLRLHAQWDGVRGGRRFPSRDDLDPVDFSFARGKISLVDVVDDPRRYRFRLWGQESVEAWGVDMTRKWIDEYPEPDLGAMLRASYDEVVAAGEPRLRQRTVATDRQKRRYEALLLPLGADHTRVEMLLITVAYAPPPPEPPSVQIGLPQCGQVRPA
jgi:hypothetical protein